jgi:hypothetical protein
MALLIAQFTVWAQVNICYKIPYLGPYSISRIDSPLEPVQKFSLWIHSLFFSAIFAAF